jgi:hypothetical protein
MTCLTLTNGNPSNGSGGAIYNDLGTLTLNRCSLVGNNANSLLTGGGGAVFTDGPLMLDNCTLAQNTSSADGGALYTAGASALLNNCTVVGNSASFFGGGIAIISPGSLTMTNTIVSGNAAGSSPNIGGSYSGADNLVGVSAVLAPLGNYGGPTPTMPPLGTSPAIGAGTDIVTNFLSTDQRGYPRRSATGVDIGAVQDQVATRPPRLITPVYLRTGLGGNSTFQFNFTNLSGASFTVFASTNLGLPPSEWSILGIALESPVGSGSFQFSDTQAGTSPRRFYRVSSP